jgi:hypothetical protein
MPARLIELYKPGDAVEIRFGDDAEESWRPAIVLSPSHPGLWVQTEDSLPWFVTNGRRIRARIPEDAAS